MIIKLFSNLLNDNTQIDGEIQVSNGFKGLIKKGLKPLNFNWFDIGNLDGYYLANKYFSSNVLSLILVKR